MDRNELQIRLAITEEKHSVLGTIVENNGLPALCTFIVPHESNGHVLKDGRGWNTERGADYLDGPADFFEGCQQKATGRNNARAGQQMLQMTQLFGLFGIRQILEKGRPGAIQTNNMRAVRIEFVAVATGEFRQRSLQLGDRHGGLGGELLHKSAVISGFKGANHVTAHDGALAFLRALESQERCQAGE